MTKCPYCNREDEHVVGCAGDRATWERPIKDVPWWKYRTLMLSIASPDLEEKLCSFGKLGYRLVQGHRVTEDVVVFIFEKQGESET